MPVGMNFLKIITLLALSSSIISAIVRHLNNKGSWSEGVTACLSVLGVIWVSWI